MINDCKNEIVPLTNKKGNQVGKKKEDTQKKSKKIEKYGKFIIANTVFIEFITDLTSILPSQREYFTVRGER